MGPTRSQRRGRGRRPPLPPGAVSGSVRSLNFPYFLKINNINFLEFSEVLSLPKQLPIRFMVLESSGIWFR